MSLLLAALAALAPGTYAWLSGRRLLAALHDPAFADLNFARSRQLGLIALAALVAVAFIAGDHFWWTMPLLVLALLAGLRPARQRLYEETWSFGRYLGYMLRSGTGMMGPWFLIFWSPVVIDRLAEVHVGAAGAAAAMLAVCCLAVIVRFPRFWLAMHRAGPLSSAELDPRFETILARATCVRPTVHRMGEPGGHVMNAFALPSAREPAVAFGDTLLERMKPDEVAAIFAHEVAHLEHFTPARMRRALLASVALIALSTGLPLALAIWSPAYGRWIGVVPFLAAFVVFARMAGQNQANETASDVRAAELTGDPETLIRALTRLHLHLRLPRHWPHEAEPSVSHPSLARRIQAIRARASSPTQPIATPTVVHSATAGSRLALDDARAYWFEGVPDDAPADLGALREQAASYRALSYSELSELRIVASGGGRALRARDLDGHAWAVAIRTADVPALEQALEVVDTRLGFRRRRSSALVARAIACVLFLALLAGGVSAVALIPLAIVLVRPGLAAVAAMGAMAMAGAAAMVLRGELAGAPPETVVAIIGSVALGAFSLWIAWSAHRADRSPKGDSSPRARRIVLDPRPAARPALVVLGSSALLMLLAIVDAAGGSDPVQLLADPLVMSLAVTCLGAAAVLTTLDRPRWRRSALVGAVVATVVMIASSRAAAIALGVPLALADAVATRLGEIPLPRAAHRLELSPSGRHWAVQSAMVEASSYLEEDDAAFRWAIGRVDASAGTNGAHGSTAVVREVEAVDLALIDDERFIALDWSGDSLVVRVEPIAERDSTRVRGASRQHTLPGLMSPELFVDVRRGWWVVTGRREDGTLVASSGTVHGGEPTHRYWPSDSLWFQPLHVSAEGAAIGYSMNAQTSVLQPLIAMLRGGTVRADLWRLDAQGRSRIGAMAGFPSCRVWGAEAVCVEMYADRSRVWRVLADGSVSPIGSLPAGYDVRHLGRAGGMAALARDGTGPLLIDPAHRLATRVELRGGVDSTRSRFAVDAQSSGDLLAILEVGRGPATIEVYRVEKPD